jgi:hypothetical protein
MASATGKSVLAEVQDGVAVAYVPPRLTPVGNLHDLLAGGSGSTCDVDGGPGNAGAINCG